MNTTEPSTNDAVPSSNQSSPTIYRRPDLKPSTFHVPSAPSNHIRPNFQSSNLTIHLNKQLNPFSASLVACFDATAKRVSLQGRALRIALTFLEFMSLTQPSCNDRLHAESDVAQQSWVMCCIYMATLVVANDTLYQDPSLQSSPSQPSILPTLTHLLTVSNMRVDDFIHHLQHAYRHCVSALRTQSNQQLLDIRAIDRMEASVSSVQSSLIRSIASYTKYTKLFKQLIQPRLDVLPPFPPQPELIPLLQRNLFGGGWLLFIVCKNTLTLSNGGESYSVITAMLAVLRIVLFNVIIVEQDLKNDTSSSYPSRVADALSASLEAVAQASADARMSADVIRASISQLDLQWMQPMLKQLMTNHSIRLPVTSQTFSQANHSSSSPIAGHPYEIFVLSVYPPNIAELGHIIDMSFPAGQQGIDFDGRVFLKDTYETNTPVEANTAPARADPQVVNPIVRTASVPHSTRRLFTSDSSDSTPAASPPLEPSQPANALHSTLSSISLTTVKPSEDSPDDPFRSSGSSSVAGSTPPTVYNSLAFSPAIRSSLPRVNQRSVSPFSRGLEAISWLTSTFSGQPDTPSNNIKLVLNRFSPDITQNIQGVVDSLANSVVFPDWDAHETPIKRSMAKKVYYVALFNLLMGELKLTSADLTTSQSTKLPPPVWITRRSLHATLLALCFEIIRSAYQPTDPSTITTETVIDPSTVSKPLFQLSWLDYFRCFDSLIVHLPGMPTCLTERLLAIEATVVESKVWLHDEKPAPMMDDPEVNDSLLRAIGMHWDTEELDDDDQPRVLPPDYTLLLQLVRRVLHRASDKLRYLCSMALLDQWPEQAMKDAVEHSIWAMFSDCLINHPQLLVGRHIDTILLCCVYAVIAKVATMQPETMPETKNSKAPPPLVTQPQPNDYFRRIITAYATKYERNLNHVARDVRVLADPSMHISDVDEQEAAKSKLFGSIVMFYNYAFIPAVKNFALYDCKVYIQGIMNNEPSTISLASAHRPIPPPAAAVVADHPNVIITPFNNEQHQSDTIEQVPIASASVHSTPVRGPMASSSFKMTIGLSPSRDAHVINSAIHASSNTVHYTDLPPLSEDTDDDEKEEEKFDDTSTNSGVDALLIASSIKKKRARSPTEQ